ncbi:MAG: HAMP domain-containing sensor histidine kinase [Acidobacteriota bacterium]
MTEVAGPDRGPNLRQRAVRAFWLFGASLITAYAGLAVWTFTGLEDRVLERQLEVEVEGLFESALVADPANTELATNSRWMTASVGTQGLPAELRASAEKLPEGIHENDHVPFFGGGDRLLAVRELPNRQERLYVLFDISELETEDESLFALAVLVLGALLTVLLGLWWGNRLAHRLTAQLTTLSRTLEASPPEDLRHRLATRTFEGEVATVASALDQSLARVERFVERERQFTRDASHELRTPVTVLGGVNELLLQRLDPSDQRGRHLLERQKRSITQMEELIEAFLWLAREEGSGFSGETADPAEVLPAVVDRHRHLLAHKEVGIHLVLDQPAAVEAPPTILAITAGNLISNAFHNTTRGQVDVQHAGQRLRVRDTGPGIPAHHLRSITEPFASTRSEPGHGLGLAIVKDLCERFGWRLTVDSTPGIGTSIEVDFAPAPNRERVEVEPQKRSS